MARQMHSMSVVVFKGSAQRRPDLALRGIRHCRPAPKDPDSSTPRSAPSPPAHPKNPSSLGDHFWTPIGGYYWMLIDTC